MKKPTLIGALLLVILLGWLVGRRGCASEETRIRQRLDRLAATLSFSAPEGNLQQAAIARKAGSFFSSDVALDLTQVSSIAESIQSREEVVQAVAVARNRLQRLRVRFADAQIRYQAQQHTAEVALVVIVDINNENNSIVQAMDLGMVRQDRQWLIASVRAMNALGRPR